MRWSLEDSADAGESHDKAEDKAKAAAAAEMDKIWEEEQQRRAAAAAGEDWRREVAERTDWVDPNSLNEHYRKHGADFGAESEEEYAEMAHEFWENRERIHVLIKDDDVEGKVRIYDPETNTFGVYTKEGKSINLYKPTEGKPYFDGQPGVLR